MANGQENIPQREHGNITSFLYTIKVGRKHYKYKYIKAKNHLRHFSSYTYGIGFHLIGKWGIILEFLGNYKTIRCNYMLNFISNI